MGISEVLADLDRRFFGGMKVRFESLTPTVTIDTTATQILPANPNRVAWIVVNKTSNPGHVDYERTVSTTQGFPAAQNGGVLNSRYEEDGRTVQSALYGITENAAGTWYRRSWELTE